MGTAPFSLGMDSSSLGMGFCSVPASERDEEICSDVTESYRFPNRKGDTFGWVERANISVTEVVSGSS